MDTKLSFGSIAKAMREDEPPVEPIWQILGMKKVAGQAGAERYRLHISDGEYSYSFAMLTTQLNNFVHEGQVENFTVVKVDRFTCNVMNGKRIIIILGLSVLTPGAEVAGKIGNPMPWNDQAANASSSRPETPQRPLAETRSASGYPNVPPKPEPRQEPKSNGLFDKKPAPTTLPPGIEQNVVPIRDVNPYVNKVTIRARVTNKGEVKVWSNPRGEGKLFSCDLLDDSGEIRITGFNKAVDDFYDIMQINNVYYISKFSVKAANKAFSSLNHEYEISFNNDTQVFPCIQDTDDIPTIQFNFVKIEDIEKIAPDSVIDVIAVCKSYGECVQLTSKSNKQLKKRELTLMDSSCKEITLTLWGKQAEDFSDDSLPVMAIKGAKVGDYGGRNLSALMSSTVQINPDVREAHELRGWFDDQGSKMQAQSLSTGGRTAGGGGAPWKLLMEANEVTTTDMEKNDYFMAKVTLMSIKRDNAMYQACTTDKCNKKVVDLGNGSYRCEKCNKELPNFQWRCMLNCNFADITDQIWVTAFQETAELIFGRTANELGEMFKNRPDEFDEVVKAVMFQDFIGKFRSRMENYNNETRKKFNIQELTRTNHAEYAKQLIAEISESGN